MMGSLISRDKLAGYYEHTNYKLGYEVCEWEDRRKELEFPFRSARVVKTGVTFHMTFQSQILELPGVSKHLGLT